MRVIVTGSRDMKIGEIVHLNLTKAYEIAVKTAQPFFVVVHGDCPTGADAAASYWVREYGPKLLSSGGIRVMEEKHPVDREKHGIPAVPIRNREMVKLGADMLLGFPKGQSKDVRGCIRMAQRAGIDVSLRECGPDE